MTDHYQTLGIERGATTPEITQAYRDLRRELSQQDPTLEREDIARRAMDVGQAYTILKDPSKRRDYDATLAAQQDSTSQPYNEETSSPGGVNYSDFFRERLATPHEKCETLAAIKRLQRFAVTRGDDVARRARQLEVGYIGNRFAMQDYLDDSFQGNPLELIQNEMSITEGVLNLERSLLGPQRTYEYREVKKGLRRRREELVDITEEVRMRPPSFEASEADFFFAGTVWVETYRA